MKDKIINSKKKLPQYILIPDLVNTSNHSQGIYEKLKVCQPITANEMAKRMHVSNTTIRDHLNSFVEDGKVFYVWVKIRDKSVYKQSKLYYIDKKILDKNISLE